MGRKKGSHTMKGPFIILSVLPLIGFAYETSTQDISLFFENERLVSQSEFEFEENDSFPFLEIFEDEEEIDDFNTPSTTIKETEALYRKMEKEEVDSLSPTPSEEPTNSKSPLFSKPKITQLPPEEEIKEDEVVKANEAQDSDPITRKENRKAPVAKYTPNTEPKQKSDLQKSVSDKQAKVVKRKSLHSERKTHARPKAIAKRNRSGKIRHK